MSTDIAAPALPREGRFVGVDVVDLTADRLRNRRLSRRFLERVFTEEERDRIDAAEDPVAETWTLWASKEAGFKVASKILGNPPVFRHRAFQVTDPPRNPQTTLRYRDIVLDLTVRADPDRIVVHAWNDPSSLVMVSEMSCDEAEAVLEFREPFEEWCEAHFSRAERDAVHSRPSAFVRLLARRDAARFLDVAEDRLAVRCTPGRIGRRPPFLYLDGEELSFADLSFSHHGGQLAWALTLPWTSPSQPPDTRSDPGPSGRA
jgi:phosphopantetheine--protein transferase-like protein